MLTRKTSDWKLSAAKNNKGTKIRKSTRRQAFAFLVIDSIRGIRIRQWAQIFFWINKDFIFSSNQTYFPRQSDWFSEFNPSLYISLHQHNPTKMNIESYGHRGIQLPTKLRHIKNLLSIATLKAQVCSES